MGIKARAAWDNGKSLTEAGVTPEARLPADAATHPGAAVGDGRLPFIPALDGLRAVAVLAVMAFHAGASWAGGGLLGVDIFFVLSGYLVTSLLLSDHARNGTIRLRRFWARRARRLLPALAVLLLGICAYARWAGAAMAPSEMRGDAFATLLYFANWHYILTDQNYFIRYGTPSPLLHTWSLAVEEQFYLLWPLVALVVLRRYGRRGIGWTATVLASCSAAACAVIYLHGASINRLYYGTDTRAQSIMIGALLAVLVPVAGDAGASGTAGSSGPLGALGFAGAAGLALCLHAAQGSGAFLYEGGFLVVALTTAAVLATAVRRPSHVLSRFLSLGPLRYTGRISYGLYLYHWPIFLVLTEARTGLTGYALLAVRFAITFAAADLSFRLLERPLRVRPGSARAIRSRRSTRPVRTGRYPLTNGFAVAGVAGLVVAALLVSTTGSTAVARRGAIAPPPKLGYVAPGGANAADPERALLIGDSMALTLGEGVSRSSTSWGVDVTNAGAVGCDLDPQSTVNVMGTVSKAAQGCPEWRATWARSVAAINPDVVVVLLGRWEEIDRLYDGRWTSVGQPAFDAHLRSELGQIVSICSARGAEVVFLTLPYIAQTTVQPDGAPWDMNLPSRTNAYNSDVRSVVAAHKSESAIVNLNQMLDPQGHYVSYIDGIRVRSSDNEHISVAGGEWLRSLLLPQLAELGAAHYAIRTGHR